jgi:hypothetical protein
MDALFVERFPFVMLDGISQIQRLPLQTGARKHGVQQLTGRAGEGLAVLVLVLARLFADHHDRRMGGPGTRNRLFRVAP